MSELINKFKSFHLEITDIFLQIADEGVTSEEGNKKLFHAKYLLLAS